MQLTPARDVLRVRRSRAARPGFGSPRTGAPDASSGRRPRAAVLQAALSCNANRPGRDLKLRLVEPGLATPLPRELPWPETARSGEARTVTTAAGPSRRTGRTARRLPVREALLERVNLATAPSKPMNFFSICSPLRRLIVCLAGGQRDSYTPRRFLVWLLWCQRCP